MTVPKERPVGMRRCVECGQWTWASDGDLCEYHQKVQAGLTEPTRALERAVQKVDELRRAVLDEDWAGVGQAPPPGCKTKPAVSAPKETPGFPGPTGQNRPPELPGAQGRPRGRKEGAEMSKKSPEQRAHEVRAGTGRVHYAPLDGSGGSAADRERVKEVMAEETRKADERLAAQARRPDPQAMAWARGELNAITESAVRLRRKAGRDLTDAERQEIVDRAPEQLREQAAEIVKTVDDEGGARLEADRLTRSGAISYAGGVPATWQAPEAEAEADTRSVQDVVNAIPRA